MAPLIGHAGRGRAPRVDRAPGLWGVGKIHARVGRGGVSCFSRQDFLLPSLCSSSLPRGGDGTSHPPRIPAPPPLRTVVPPPSWHVRLRKDPNPSFGGPGQGDAPAVVCETYRALLPSLLGRGALRRAEAGLALLCPMSESRSGKRLPRQCNSQKKGSLLLTRARAPAATNAVVQGQRAPNPSCYTNL